LPWRKKRRIANNHYKDVMLWKYFKLITKFVRGRSEIGKGGHGGKKKYTGRQKWQKRHNLFLIMQHHGTKMLRSHFQAWRMKSKQLAGVRRAFSGHMNQKIINIVKAWRIQATLSTRRKKIVIEEWKNYSMALWKVPFRAWYVWTQTRIKEQQASRILLSAWERKKLRDLKYQVFKVWRHQAAYGKVEGMFTRVRLLRTLDEQKALIKTIGETMDVTQDTLNATKNSLENQIQLNFNNIKKLEGVTSKSANIEFALHNAEQEIVRLQSIIDSVSIIHPGTIKQLDMMGDNKKFEQRGLESLARSRASHAASGGGNNTGGSGGGKSRSGSFANNNQNDSNENKEAVVGIETIPNVLAPQLGASNVLNVNDQKGATSTNHQLAAQKNSEGQQPNTVQVEEQSSNGAGAGAGAGASNSASNSAGTNSSMPPSDAPIDSVWVKPSDAQLILRARSIHDILETHPELQDEETTKIKFAAEQRAWKERTLKNKALQLQKEEEKKQTKQREEIESSKTTGHALKFVQRIGSKDVTDSKNEVPGSTINNPEEQNEDKLDKQPVFIDPNEEEYDDSVEILRLRGLLSFLLYSDHEKLKKTEQLIIGGDSGVDANLPPEIIRDDEDLEIEQRRRNLRRLGRNGNWSSFVEDLTARFPLRHPVNLNTQDRMLIRIGDAKARRNRHENEKRPPFNILKSNGSQHSTQLPSMKRK
jgi:hypothetical protein